MRKAKQILALICAFTVLFGNTIPASAPVFAAEMDPVHEHEEVIADAGELSVTGIPGESIPDEEEQPLQEPIPEEANAGENGPGETAGEGEATLNPEPAGEAGETPDSPETPDADASGVPAAAPADAPEDSGAVSGDATQNGAEGQPLADEGTGESISAPAEPVLPAPAGTEESGSPEPAEPAPVQTGEQTPSGTEPAVTEPSQPSDPEPVPPPAQDDGSAGIRMF